MHNPLILSRLILFFALPALAAPSAVFSQETAPRTGAFETTFDQRCPLNDPKVFAKRLKLPGKPPEFDLNKDAFLVFVPKSYDASKPIGLIVLANYKPADALPEVVFPQLEEANIAFVVARRFADDWPERAALAIHAAHNMRSLYNIDPRRVYIFGGGERPTASGEAYTAQRLGLCFPDLFTGALTSAGIGCYKPVKSANGGTYRPQLPRPDDAQLNLARQHPFILSVHDQNDAMDRFAKSYTQDGFRQIKYIRLTPDQLHYPIYTTDWLPDAIAFLDQATAKLKLPTTKPAK